MSKRETFEAIPADLLAWVQTQTPETWHEIARGVDFTDPRGGIDPLLAAYWITRQPHCDRATALLFLARAIEAGFLVNPPAHHDLRATRAFCLWLHLRLDDGTFERADLRLSTGEADLVQRHLGLGGNLGLPPSVLALGAQACQTAICFSGWHALRPLDQLRPAIRAA